MIVVSDTSPITSLLQIRRVELLQQLYHDVLIPEAVLDELSVLHSSLPEFIKCVRVANHAEVNRLLSELDPGEAEAIVLAKEQRADVVLMDETEGRRVASREGVPFIGLLGVLLQTKKAGLVNSLREVISELEREAAFHISEEIKTVVLRQAGEL